MHLRIYAKTQACSLLSQKAPVQLFGVCLPQEVPASACLSCTLLWISHNVHCNSTQCCSLIGTQTIRPKRRLLLHLGGTQLLLQEVADLRFFCTNLSEIHLATTTSFGTAYSYTATSCVADLPQVGRHIYSTPFRLTACLFHIHFQNCWSTTVDRGRVSRILINAGNCPKKPRAITVFMNIISLHKDILIYSNQGIFSGWVGLTTMKISMGFTSII